MSFIDACKKMLNEDVKMMKSTPMWAALQPIKYFIRCDTHVTIDNVVVNKESKIVAVEADEKGSVHNIDIQSLNNLISSQDLDWDVYVANFQGEEVLAE